MGVLFISFDSFFLFLTAWGRYQRRVSLHCNYTVLSYLWLAGGCFSCINNQINSSNNSNNEQPSPFLFVWQQCFRLRHKNCKFRCNWPEIGCCFFAFFTVKNRPDQNKAVDDALSRKSHRKNPKHWTLRKERWLSQKSCSGNSVATQAFLNFAHTTTQRGPDLFSYR